MSEATTEPSRVRGPASSRTRNVRGAQAGENSLTGVTVTSTGTSAGGQSGQGAAGEGLGEMVPALGGGGWWEGTAKRGDLPPYPMGNGDTQPSSSERGGGPCPERGPGRPACWPLTAHGGLAAVQHQEGGGELKAGSGHVTVQGGVHLPGGVEGPPVGAGAPWAAWGHPHARRPLEAPRPFTPLALPDPRPPLPSPSALREAPGTSRTRSRRRRLARSRGRRARSW